MLNPAATWKPKRVRGPNAYQVAKKNNPLAQPLPFGNEERFSVSLVQINHGRYSVCYTYMGWQEGRVVINTKQERKARRVVRHFDIW